MTDHPQTPPSLDRYHRQMLLPGVGEAGQRRLGAGHAVVVGCGALGCASADLLARAGVGTLTLIDRDVVELTNLQRQTLYSEEDARDGIPKAQAAARRLRAVNSSIAVRAVVADLTHRNAERLLAEPATAALAPSMVLVDGTDNFQTRYLLNDLAVKHGLPYAYGGVVGTGGMAMTVMSGRTACLRCVFDEPPAPGSTPTCDTAGVLGPAVAMVAALQVADVLKLLVGAGSAVETVLTEFDVWSNRERRVDLSRARREECVCCGRRRFEFLDGTRAEETTLLCGQNAVQVWPEQSGAGGPGSSNAGAAGTDGVDVIDLPRLAARLAAHGQVAAHPYMLRARLSAEKGRGGSPIELTVFADGRAVVRGTDEPGVARAIYSRYVGL